ncbi:MAG: ABC transporter ATP-binding protein/permease [Oscillospiraceae bacterium]|nr:ABC transporter ATP-binding protein/permease [Oscillospiraceae bacterium]
MPEERYTKPKDRKKTLLRLSKYLIRHKWGLFFAAVLTVAGNLFALVGPYLSGRAIDAIGTTAGEVDFKSVFIYCVWIILFYIASSGLTYILSVVMINISQKIVYRMRRDMFDRLSGFPVGAFDVKQAGDIVSRMSYDIDTVNASLSNHLVQICASFITVIVSFVMMMVISPPLVLAFIVTIPVSVIITRYLTRKVRPYFRKRSGKLGEMNGFVEEVITGLKTIKVYHREKVITRRFDRKNTEAVDAYFNADYHGSMVGPCVNFVNNLALTLVSAVGAALFLFGQIMLGDLSAFVLYSRKFSGPINEMANILSELQSSMAAAERVFRLIDEPVESEDEPDAHALEDVKGVVEMKNICFGYGDGKTVINDLNLYVSAGSLVAIVGPTGAGKTTLVNLLMRFYDPQSGIITVDGHDIRKVTRSSLRRSFAMVLQETWLFEGSVYDNIAYGKPGASLEEVTEAAKAAGIHPYISSLPEGYSTILSEEGSNISKGQKQLLTIARAMLADTRMLILDEATSNVDTHTERFIQQAMRKLMRNKTCFVIAHRLSTIRNADTILVVKDGQIAEQGKHNELIEREGIYAGLYSAQFC